MANRCKASKSMVAGVSAKPSNKYFLLCRAEKQELGKLGRWALWAGSRHLPSISEAKGELGKKVLHRGHGLIETETIIVFFVSFALGCENVTSLSFQELRATAFSPRPKQEKNSNEMSDSEN